MQEEAIICVTREIERVITTPYIPSLHNLERAVDDVPSNGLRQWATCKPCQVPLLGAVLLEQFPQTCNLLAKFGRLQVFRDALLEKEPALLDKLLHRAVDSGNEDDIDICVSLLSSPLPQEIAIPARVPIFLTRLLCEVAQNPCAAKIRPLHEVMEGLLSNSDLIKILPNDLMGNFQREGTKILRNLNNPLETLLSLATFARIRRLWRPINLDNREHQPQWLTNINQIFGPKSAAKTLDLVIISAVMACSNSCSGYTHQERVTLLELAIEISHSIDEDQRKTWISANSAKLAKLCDKLRRPDINAEIQVIGLVLLTTLSEWLSLPQEFYQMMRDRLFTEMTWNVLESVSENVRYILIDRVITHSNDSENLNLFKFALSALSSSDDTSVSQLTNLGLGQLVLSTIRRSEKSSFVLRSHLQRMPLEDIRMLQSCVQEIATCHGSARCEGSLICYNTLKSYKDRLCLELLGCFLFADTTDALETYDDSSKPRQLIANLLDTLQKNTARIDPCLFSQIDEPERINSLIRKTSKLTATVQRDGASHEWRSRVAGLLIESAKSSHDTIIQQMEVICQDFETRCTRVEEPLATAIQERDKLGQELGTSKQLNHDLEDQLRKSVELVSALKTQLNESIAKVNDYSYQVEHLTDQLDALQTELDATRQDSRGSVERIQAKARDRELDLMATVAERDDLLEEQQLQMESIFKERENLMEKLTTASERNQVVSRECDDLHQEIVNLKRDAVQECDMFRHEITKLQQVMEIRESTNVEKDNRIATLNDTNKDISNENQVLREKLEQANSNEKTLMSALEEERQSHKSDMNQRMEKHKLDVDTIRHNAAKAAARSDKDIRVKDRRIQHLEKKVESLRTERAAKAREFSEAQQHISRLMNVMGFRKDKKDENTNNKRPQDGGPSKVNPKEVRRSSRLSTLQTQSYLQSQGELTTMQPQSSIVSPSARAAESFHQDTTIRRRSHRISEVMSFGNDTSYSLLPVSTGDEEGPEQAGEHAPSRQPLGTLDRNSPHKSLPSSQHIKQTSTTFHDQDDNNQETQAEQIESQPSINITGMGDIDLDFDEDELLTSTIAR